MERIRKEGCSPEMMRLIHRYCSDWIQKHILRIDVNLRSCQTLPPDAAAEESLDGPR
jgi:hypothetical protein